MNEIIFKTSKPMLLLVTDICITAQILFQNYKVKSRHKKLYHFNARKNGHCNLYEKGAICKQSTQQSNIHIKNSNTKFHFLYMPDFTQCQCQKTNNLYYWQLPISGLSSFDSKTMITVISIQTQT
jgi:hypothetical protein